LGQQPHGHVPDSGGLDEVRLTDELAPKRCQERLEKRGEVIPPLGVALADCRKIPAAMEVPAPRMVDGLNPFVSSLLSLPEKFADVVLPILNRNVAMTDDCSRRVRTADTTFNLGT
jgi:hypothetical protein